MIFKLPDILTVDFNSVDECDSLYTYTLRNCLYFIPLRKPIDKFSILFYKNKNTVGYNVGDYVGAH